MAPGQRRQESNSSSVSVRIERGGRNRACHHALLLPRSGGANALASCPAPPRYVTVSFPRGRQRPSFSPPSLSISFAFPQSEWLQISRGSSDGCCMPLTFGCFLPTPPSNADRQTERHRHLRWSRDMVSGPPAHYPTPMKGV